jgi:hypothetical protein
MISAQIVNGRSVISLPLQDPKPSMSGETLLVASTRGSVATDATVDGKPIVVVANAFIRP